MKTLPQAILLLSALFAILPAANAQSYSINWWAIGNGGGTSTNRSFSVTSAIGKTDAGRMTNANFAIDGGFLSGIELVQTAGAPLLSIVKSGSNATISWAADASVGFNLEEAPNLNSPSSWDSSATTVTTNGNQKSVTIPALSGIRFYRLHKP